MIIITNLIVGDKKAELKMLKEEQGLKMDRMILINRL
jgi:hypothetical protein